MMNKTLDPIRHWLLHRMSRQLLLMSTVAGCLAFLPAVAVAQVSTPGSLTLSSTGPQRPLPVQAGRTVTNSFVPTITLPSFANCEVDWGDSSFWFGALSVTNASGTIGSCTLLDASIDCFFRFFSNIFNFFLLF